MILSRALRIGTGIGFYELEALGSELLTCRVKQGCCNALAPKASRYDETQDRADALGMRDRLGVEYMEQFARRRVAPTDHLASVICEEALHLTLHDALACASAVFRSRSAGPVDLRMVLVEALAIARGPLRVVAECFTLEEGHEVREAAWRQGVNLDGGDAHKGLCGRVICLMTPNDGGNPRQRNTRLTQQRRPASG